MENNKFKNFIVGVQSECPVEWELEGLKLGVAEAIYRAMEDRGINQSQVAEKMGVDRAVISRILGGQVNVTLETMAKVAVALGCTWITPRLTFGASEG